ncbi:MAG TPA: phosphotransferase [Pilimelia sp.]|nr:phosphotransferase [Pilimelia sp.]
MDGQAWPRELELYRAEAAIAARLPAAVPAPRLLGTHDDGRWTILAFDHVDGAEPARPWVAADLDRVVRAAGRLARAVTPSPIRLPRDHPRLGGWADLASDEPRLARLRAACPWAADNLGRLVALENEGLAAAAGDSLVHFDLYPHNILLTRDDVVFVDWPHARLGAPVLDLICVLSSAAADGLDPEPYLLRAAGHPPAEPRAVDAILSAHAGFLLAGAVTRMPPGLEPIAAAKLHLGVGAARWLRQRLFR